jgi:hypothetical protein
MHIRTVEIVVALLFLSVATVVMYDSYRLGAGWGVDGPETGYFPFYIALIMFVASGVNLVHASLRGSGLLFVGWEEFKRVLMVLLPTAVYVAAIPYIGIYAAAAVFIAYFMVVIGGHRITSAILAAAVVPIFFFLLFEVWFLVPLPKGPIETALGY